MKGEGVRVCHPSPSCPHPPHSPPLPPSPAPTPPISPLQASKASQAQSRQKMLEKLRENAVEIPAASSAMGPGDAKKVHRMKD